MNVPVIELKDVGSGSPNGVLVGDFFAQLFPAVVAGVMEKGKGVIPAGLLGELAGSVAEAGKALGEGAAKFIGQAGEGAAKLFGDILKTGKNIGDKLPKLLPGKKSD